MRKERCTGASELNFFLCFKISVFAIFGGLIVELIQKLSCVFSPTKNGSQAPPTAVAISQHKNPFAKVLNMVHPTTPESSPPSYRLDVPKQ